MAHKTKRRLHSNWKRKLTKQEKNNCIKAYQKIKECKETSQGLNSVEILSILNMTRFFIGVYAQNQVTSLSISAYPSFLIVNLDSQNLPGSHWIAIGIFSNHLEIFDPLGFNIFTWPHIPCELLSFLLKFSVGRKVVISDQIQSKNSTLCGFYCIFYILCRNTLQLPQLQRLFTTKLYKNDKKLIHLFG